MLVDLADACCSLSLEASLPNAACHYAVGDVVRWSGIKRAGAALAMGRIAAVNIFAGFVAAEAGHKGPIDLVAFPEVPPMMALAVGNQAVAFGPGQGVTHGKESMQMLFGDDLGWSSKCSRSLRTSSHPLTNFPQ